MLLWLQYTVWEISASLVKSMQIMQCTLFCYRSGHMPKLIPKSPIMSWDDDADDPSLSPPDMLQYPFNTSQQGDMTPRRDMDSSFQDRQPLQPRENLHNFSDPYQGQGYDPRQSGSDFGTFPRDARGPGGQPQNGRAAGDPRYPADRMDRNRGSQRSNMSQGQQYLPDDQRSMSSHRSGQYPSNTMPRNMRGNKLDSSMGSSNLDTSMRSVGSHRSQGYNSLPRDSRSRLAPPGEGQDRPYSHSSPRQPSQGGERRKEDNPYMMMSPHNQSRSDR